MLNELSFSALPKPIKEIIISDSNESKSRQRTNGGTIKQNIKRKYGEYLRTIRRQDFDRFFDEWTRPDAVMERQKKGVDHGNRDKFHFILRGSHLQAIS